MVRTTGKRSQRQHERQGKLPKKCRLPCFLELSRRWSRRVSPREPQTSESTSPKFRTLLVHPVYLLIRACWTLLEAWILAINCDQLVACRLQGQREILLLAVGLRIANNADLYRPHLLRDSSRSNIEVQHTLGISSDPLGQFGGLHYSRCRTMLPRAFYQALRYTVCAALIRKRGNCVHAPRQILGRR
jgi:hypothetical protein